jgi:hypothetical protein
MALTYSIDPKRRRVTVVATAQPTFEQWVLVHDAFLHDPAFRPGYDILWDRRAYTSAPDRAYIERVVQWWRDHQATLGEGRIATVVPDAAAAAYGMARMAEILGRAESNLRAFNDLAEAVRWLDERFSPDAPGPHDDGPGSRRGWT